MIPTFSEGPPEIVCTTSNVSSIIWKTTPIPSKLPSNGSFSFLTSSADMYDEWGSKLDSIPRMPFSTIFSESTEST